MTTHYRELEQLFDDYLGTKSFADDVDATGVRKMREMFQRRTVFAASENFGFTTDHEIDALQRVANKVLLSGKESGACVEEILDAEEARLTWKFLAKAVEDPRVLELVDREVCERAIEYHYATLRPRQFDIFVHLSGSEMFFIDGDSLLMAALSSPHVDWDLMQTLHVHHHAQSLLYRLQSRGARFHVVFFKDQRWFWEKSPQKLLMRENLRLVLEEVTESNPQCGFSVSNFESFSDPKFVEYMQTYEPEFILMSDGEQLGKEGWLHSMYHNTEVEVEHEESKTAYRSLVDDTKLGDEVSFYYHCFLVWAHSKRLKVAFSSRVVVRENAVIVFAATARSAQFTRALFLESVAVSLAKEHVRDICLPLIPERSVSICQKEKDLYFREKVIGGAVYAFLHREVGATLEERELCLALLMTAYTMVYVDLPERAQHRVKSDGVTAFLNAIAPYVQEVFTESREDWTGVEFDVLDGHLLCAVVQQLRERSVGDLLGSRLLEDVEIAWGDVLGENVEMLKRPLTTLPEVEQKEEGGKVRCPHLEHELVSALSKRLGVDAPDGLRPIAGGNGNAENLYGWKLADSFMELNDVVDKQEEEKKEKGMTEWQRRKKEEMEALFKADAQRQAKSMGLTNFTNERIEQVTVTNTEAAEAKSKVNKEHEGQKNRRKETTKKDEVVFQNLLQTASDTVANWDVRIRKVVHDFGQTKGLDAEPGTIVLHQLQALLADLRDAKFESNFDPREKLGQEGIARKRAVWRALVRWRQDNRLEEEPLFVAEMLRSSSHQANPSKEKKKALLNFSVLVEQATEEHVPALKETGITGVALKRYLYWVVLSYLRVHFSTKVMCYILRVYQERWRSERESARSESRMVRIDVGIPVFIWCHHRILACVRDTGIFLSVEEMNVVRSALAHFDFSVAYYQKLDQHIAEWQGGPLKPLMSNLQPRDKVWNETPERTQLLHMGHKLERPVLVEKEYRVGFNPDAWQRELLDIVDRRGSAVVCAPTSAGKTFISYYCMLKTLRSSNTRMVAYVAPTRALINQAVVDVCARYGSKTYDVPGMNVYGILGGGDYHWYHRNCQVIITLPEVLETILLSPAYQDVAERLDYVILDEIHTMESSGNGDVWQRVLSLLPCPFVALSATLGQTEKLCAWLNRVQDRLGAQEGRQNNRDYKVYNVPSNGKPIQRWNDIKKYIYLPPPGFKPTLRKVTGEYKNRFIKDLHPLSILTLEQIRYGFPPDISLVPSEVVQLYEALNSEYKIIEEKWPSVIKVMHMGAQLKKLKPEEYFKKMTYITQSAARQYESEVKFAFVQWVNLTWEPEFGKVVDKSQVMLDAEEVHAFQEMMTERCTAVLRSFSLELRQQENVLNETAIKSVEEQMSSESAVLEDASSLFSDSRQFVASNIISVLRELSTRSLGPTIVFSFETQDCDDLVRAVVEQLEYAEDLYRKTDEYKSQESKRQTEVQKMRDRRKQEESTKKQKRTKDKDGDAMRNDRGGPEEGYEVLEVDEDEPDVLEEFTFLRKNMSSGAGNVDGPQYEQSSVESALWDCRSQKDDLARRAIMRGIGIHHAGLKGKIRRAMEVLFRTGYSGVIFATETLALGIHSPCRSVVLAGDHVLLNATQFRQMMGRAGRRGLDDLGHLVFVSVSLKKITRLMTSSTTVIKGNVQMDAISMLRMLQLYEYPQHRAFMGKERRGGDVKVDAWRKNVVNMVERLFVNPLFYAGVEAVEGGNLEPLMVNLFRLLLDYFSREGLYNTEMPSSLGSLLVDAMHVFRNAGVGAEGFAFINMLTNKVLEEACYPPTLDYLNSKVHASGQRGEAVTELLSYLFSLQKMCNIPLEIHRSALSDPAVINLWKRRTGSAKHHRVVLAPLSLLNPHGVVMDHTLEYRFLSTFYTWMASKLKSPSSKRLPYMNSRARRPDPIFGAGAGTETFPMREILREMAVEYTARDPLVAISGCGDSFLNMEDLTTTLRSGLFCDPRILPVYDFTDGCRHDGAQVLINACLADFIRCNADRNPLRSNTFRFTQLERLNGLTQSEAYAVLTHAGIVLGNIAGPQGLYPVIQRLYPEESESERKPELAGADVVVEVAKMLQSHQGLAM